jgi:putative aldouronate transport system permease protein
MLIPVLTMFAIFEFWPMWWLSIAFKDYFILRGFGDSPWVGFAHFVDFFNGREFWMLLRNTILLNLYNLVFGFPAPIIFALLLNELRHALVKRVIQTITYLPHFISIVIVVALVMQVLSPSTGVVNIIIKKLGGEPIFFMARERYFRGVYVGSVIWQQMGWQSIIFLAALSGIDPQLYEASIIDGANRWRQAISITIPSILSTIAVMFILRVGFMVRVGFERIWLMGNETNRQVSEVIATYVYRRGILHNDYSFATAVGVFEAFLALFMVLFANWVSKKATGTSIF